MPSRHGRGRDATHTEARAGWKASAREFPGEASHEHVIAGVDRGAVLQRDDLDVAVKAGVDLPLVAGTYLREGRALRCGAEAREVQAVARRHAVAAEVGDHVAGGLAGGEHEGVVAAVAGEQ